MQQNPLYLYQIIYAELMQIPYNPERVNAARRAVYQLANVYGLDIKGIRASLKPFRKDQRKAAKALSDMDQMKAAVSVMGTVSALSGELAGHVFDEQEVSLPGLQNSILRTLGTLDVIGKMPVKQVQ